MTTDTIIMTYKLSARDRMRNQAILDRLSLKRRNPRLHFATCWPVMLIAGLYSTYVVIPTCGGADS